MRSATVAPTTARLAALALFVSGAAALAPVGAGVAYQLIGGYDAVFAGLAAISVLAAVAMLGMPRWG